MVSLTPNSVRSIDKSISQELLKRPVVQDNAILFNKINNSASNRQDFSAMIDSWKDHNILPVLCLDRFDEIIDNRKNFSIDFYDNLRSLMDRSSLMLILASRKKLDVYRNISSFFNVGNVCSLTGLTEGEASDLVRLPERNVHGSTAVLSETKQKLALQWGKRNPYLLQLAGCCLWEAIASDHDEAWARQRFDSEAQRVTKSPLHPRSWWPPLRWLCWEIPLRIGKLAKAIGGRFDDFSNWILGITCLIIVGLVFLGVLHWSDLLKWLRDALGK